MVWLEVRWRFLWPGESRAVGSGMTAGRGGVGAGTWRPVMHLGLQPGKQLGAGWAGSCLFPHQAPASASALSSLLFFLLTLPAVQHLQAAWGTGWWGRGTASCPWPMRFSCCALLCPRATLLSLSQCLGNAMNFDSGSHPGSWTSSLASLSLSFHICERGHDTSCRWWQD